MSCHVMSSSDDIISNTNTAIGTEHNNTTASNTTTEASKNEEHNIKVYTRLRPLSSLCIKANQEIIQKLEGHTLVVNTYPPSSVTTASSSSPYKKNQPKKVYEFESIFGPTSTQEEVYTQSIKSVINDNIWKGYNVTIFAYGQSGSGKTYTMGTQYDNNERRPVPLQEEKKDDLSFVQPPPPEQTLGKEDGVIPRVVHDLFQRSLALQQETHGTNKKTSVSIYMSYLEIYNEEIRDLLVPEHTTKVSNLKIRDDATNGGVYVSNLTNVKVTNAMEVHEVMKDASTKRKTALTALNAVSSRSHAICTFSVKVESEEEEGVICSKLTLVDLAGSERVKRSGAIGERLSEGIHINKGLLVLGQVISTLSEQHQQKNSRLSNSHIPYRDSKLTRLLQDSLGGNSRTIMIACVSPSVHDRMESINTLRYAQRARNIKNSSGRNYVSSLNPTLSAAEAMALQRENQYLKMQLQRFTRSSNATASNNTVAPSTTSPYPQEHNHNTKKENILQRQKEQLTKEVSEYKKRNAILQRRIRDEASKRAADQKEHKKQTTKLLRDNQKLKCEFSKVQTKASKQSAILRRKAADTVKNQRFVTDRHVKGLHANASRKVSVYKTIDVYPSRKKMTRAFERDVELATLILETQEEIQFVEGAIRKEKQILATKDTSTASNDALTHVQSEIDTRSCTIESLQKRILDCSHANTNPNNEDDNVVLLTVAQSLSYAELKYLVTHCFDVLVLNKRHFSKMLASAVKEACLEDRRNMVEEMKALETKYEQDVIQFLECGIDYGTKVVIDDMLGSHFPREGKEMDDGVLRCDVTVASLSSYG